MTAAQFLGRIRRQVRKIVADWTGIYQYTIDKVLEDIIVRCRELKLRLATPEDTGAAGIHRAADRAGHELPAQRPSPGGPMKPQRVLTLVHKGLEPPDEKVDKTTAPARPSGAWNTTWSAR